MRPEPANGVALIIGGAGGVGRAVAHRMARDGWQLVIASREQARAEAVATSLPLVAGGPHVGVGLNVMDEVGVQVVVDEIRSTWGCISVQVCSVAPATHGLPQPTVRLSLQDWNRSLHTLLTGVFIANRAVLGAMRAAKAGTIINIGSALTRHGPRGRAFAQGYSAGKYALRAYTESLHEEMSIWGGRALLIAPGAVDTPLIAGSTLAREFGGSLSPSSLADAIALAAMGDVAAKACVLRFVGGEGGVVRG